MLCSSAVDVPVAVVCDVLTPIVGLGGAHDATGIGVPLSGRGDEDQHVALTILDGILVVISLATPTSRRTRSPERRAILHMGSGSSTLGP